MKMTDEMSKGKPESQSPLQTGFDKKFWDKQKDKPVSKADNTIQYLEKVEIFLGLRRNLDGSLLVTSIGEVQDMILKH
jgi:hypothetical protein